MNPFKFLFVLLLFPLSFHAQQHSLTGLWTGALTNDNNTVRKDQVYELGLTEYRGKVYGYSRMSFTVNDTLFYVVKRVKGTIIDTVCEIKDNEILSSNYQTRDKRVGLTITFRMSKQDTTWHLDGTWETNKTKNFYSIKGGIAMREEKNFDKSKLFPHLEELGLDKDVPFYQQSKTPPVVAIAKSEPTPVKPVPKEAPPVAAITKTETAKVENIKKSEEKSIAKVDPPKEKVLPKAEEKKKADAEKKVEEKAIAKVETPKDPEKQKPVTNSAVSNTSTAQNSAVTKPKETDLVKTPPPVTAPAAAAKLAERKTTPPQLVSFKTDSLELALYDNGEVDGDTVSVLLNGELILAKQGLKTVAIKKSIKIAAGTDEMTLVLYAENLGKYPPNTGLLIVHDGDDSYQIRFSADLQQNATIIFRRKK